VWKKSQLWADIASVLPIFSTLKKKVIIMKYPRLACLYIYKGRNISVSSRIYSDMKKKREDASIYHIAIAKKGRNILKKSS